MDVRIGVIQTAKEIDVDLGDDADRDDVQKQVDTALSKGGTLWLTDKNGGKVGIVAEKVAYVEIGPSTQQRKVGFVG